MFKQFIFFLFTLCLIPIITSANSDHLDSLKKELNLDNSDYNPNDIVQYYYQNYQEFTTIDSVSLQFSEILKNASRNQYIDNEIARSIILNDFGKPQEATSILARLALIKSVRQNKNQIAVICNTMGNIYFRVGNQPKARSFYRQYQTYMIEANDLRGIKASTINIGSTFYHVANYDSARFYFETAMEMERNGEMSFQLNLLNNMALIHMAFDENDKALINYESLMQNEDLDLRSKIVILKNYARSLSAVQRYDDALTALYEAEEISISLDESHYYTTILKDQGQQYANKRMFEEAYTKLRLADSLFNANLDVEPEKEIKALTQEHEKQLIEKENSLNEEQLKSTKKQAARLRIFMLILGFLTILIIFLLIRSRKLFKSVDQKNKELSILNETIDAFNLHVSHDLKTILNNTQAMSSMIVKYNDKQDSDKVREITNKIIQITKNGKAKIAGFIELGKTSSFIPQNNSRKLIPKIEIESILTKNGLLEAIDVEVHGTEISSFIIGETPFESIFLNFFSNSIKYNQNYPSAQIFFKHNSKTLEIIYVDNGIGIDMEKDGKALFSPYKRIQNDLKGEGTGIGLFMVRKIILQHGGKITAESKLGKGLTFYITLPLK